MAALLLRRAEDIAAARELLAAKGLDLSEIFDMGGVKYAYFADPDGNSWALQEISARQMP